MPQFVSCPRCRRRSRIPDTLRGRKVKCPDCAEIFTAAAGAPAPPAEKEAPAKKKDEGRADGYEIVDDAEEERSRRRRRRREKDDEEEERPRRRKRKRPQPEGDGPWQIAAGATAACAFLSFLVTLVSMGTGGLPESREGLGIKVGSLLFGLGVSLVLMAVGLVGVKNRVAYGRWGDEIRGTFGVILSACETVLGGLLAGFILYGLLFTVLHGR